MIKFANFSSSINPTLLTFRCLNFSRPPTFLLCKGFSSHSLTSSTISYLKVVDCRVNVQSLFRTSPPRRLPPVVWFVLRPVLKMAAVITGRSIRGWWKNLPKDKKKYFINELKDNRRKIGKFTRYLSTTIQNEMIECLRIQLENHLIEQVRASPFFTIIIDMAQDISKADQLSIAVRYALIPRMENGLPVDIEVKEVFLSFYTAIKQGATELVN
ncbi:zinc finger MYM-type protein 1-like [Trichonephila clavata]|uniref:Zinc finger MYM-type protein 1-like n=1 Tax=Trichonephila clavata TaxID=2740835 RepID=A0A8X6L838_TRICU|nr:zinc finger MYM-type protein 1-like [Trichonephila clavata]